MMAVIPIDFYHHHQSVLSASSSQFSLHNEHRAPGAVNISSYCLICNLHLDRQYDFFETAITIATMAIVFFGIFDHLYFHYLNVALVLTSRGPPVVV